MKGIILAGGSGTRLLPLTKVTCKQLLPIYDKPLIYYPLSVLMLAGITDICIITTERDQDAFETLLGDGQQLGIKICYKTQSAPRGIPEAFMIAEDFIQNEPVCLILGDNIFYGEGLPKYLKNLATLKEGACLLGYYVKDPKRYGVATLDKQGNLIGLEEKPEKPKSNYAITGIYFYDNQVVEMAKQLMPSKRHELEITDLNKAYLANNQCQFEILGRGIAWLDTGTPESLQEASRYVEVIESRQGLKIACLEEIAYRMGYIDKAQFIELTENYPNSQYREYLEEILLRE